MDEMTEREKAAWAKGFGAALGSAAVAAGREAADRYWEGLADGLRARAEEEVRQRRILARVQSQRSLTRPPSRAVAR